MSSLKYIELKSGYSDNGPAWIALVDGSKSGRTIYFNGLALKRASGIKGNYIDTVSRAEYWVSGVKKSGTNRHSAGSGRVLVEAAALPELLKQLGTTTLDSKVFAVTNDIRPTSAGEFVASENSSRESE
ncbi:MAG: hypothetical protein ABIQ65_21015 [Thermoanaerobaculia bacterium]